MREHYGLHPWDLERYTDAEVMKIVRDVRRKNAEAQRRR